jgi:hypothetical protein
LAPTQILYSQEVREYSLSFCLAVAVILCFSRFLDKQSAGRTWALGLTISLAMAVQHGLILLVAALNLVFFFELIRSKQPFKTFKLWLIAQLPGLAVAIAVYVTTISGQKLVSGDMVKLGYLADRYWDRTAHGLFTLLMGDGSGIIGFAYPGPIMVILFLLGLVCISTNGTRRAAGFLIAPVAITLALALLGLYPFGGIRQDIFMLPMIYVCASIGLAVVSTWLFKNVNHGGKRIIELLLLTALVLPGLRATYVYLQGAGPQPMRPLVNELRENIQADDRIYVHFSAMPAFQYYWPDKSEPWLKGTEHMVGLGRPERAEKQQLAVTRELALLVEDPGTLWIMLSHLPEEELDSIIPRVEPPRVVEMVAGMNGSWLYRIGERTGSIL